MGFIRLLLALSVVAAHCGAIFGCTLIDGRLAVQSFYIISGFYMSIILNEKYIGVNDSYRLFITNRFIRLYPIYWTILLCTLLVCVGVVFGTKGHSQTILSDFLSFKLRLSALSYMVLTNLIIFGQDVVFFLGISPGSGNLFFTTNFRNSYPPLFTFLFAPQAWTLGLELSFYLIAPFILRRGLKTVVTIIILSFLLRLVLYDHFNLKNDPWTYRFFPTELMFFLLGYISYRIHLVRIRRPISTPVVIAILVFISIFTVGYSHFPPIIRSWFPFSIREMLYFSTIVISIPLLFNSLKKSRLDNKIGELSYPIYISHMLVLMICKLISEKYALTFLNAGWVIALITIIVAYLLNVIVAAPIEKFRQSRLKGPGPLLKPASGG